MRRIKQWISQIIFPFGITFNVSKVKSSCFVEIKNTALALQANNDLRSYNKYINKLSEQKFKRIKFVGQGACIDTTATHTIVSLSNQQFYFEKIFNVNSIHYKRFINNYPLIQNPLIERGITIPKLKSNYELFQISICHFEYFDTLIQVDENILKYGLSIISKFKTISFNESFITKDYTEINYLRYCINALFNE